MSNEKQELYTRLAEAANLGHWLEARLHLAFTEMADGLFADGKMTRDERIALSGAIGEALTAFNDAVTANVPSVYEREPWRGPEATPDMSEAEPLQERAIEGEFIPLVERAVRSDGTIPIKIIEPGWGSSGYYPRAVLERDGPLVFKAGTKQFWNHPTTTEEAQRPEGDLNALAAELVSDARFAEGPEGPGLYADAKVFGPYRDAVNELAKHIGVSIRAQGRAVQGEAEGRKGPIVQQLTAAKSVDFVTSPGAGGRILEMFEAARPQRSVPQTPQEEPVDEKMLKEALQQVEQVKLENARLREAMLLRDAREFVRDAVAGANVPDVTKARLVESLSGNPPVTEASELDTETYRTRITEAVKAEVEYLTKAAGFGSGRIEGMGGSGAAATDEAEQAERRMVEAFQSLGLSESGAKIAATGRKV